MIEIHFAIACLVPVFRFGFCDVKVVQTIGSDSHSIHKDTAKTFINYPVEESIRNETGAPHARLHTNAISCRYAWQLMHDDGLVYTEYGS
jgi:hypothetical protein